MAIVKRCSCRQPCRNPEHPYHIRLNLRRGHAGDKPESGAVSKYAFLLPPGGRLPETKAEALDLEALVRTWVLQGRPAVATAPDTDPSPEPEPESPGVTIATAAAVYLREYVEPELADSRGNQAGIVRRIARELGSQPIDALVDQQIARSYLAGVLARAASHRRNLEAPGAGGVNRHRSRWSHFMNWCRREYGLTGESPFFHRTIRPHGLKGRTESDGRDRRLRPGEDEALIAGCRTIDDGGMMLARYYAAVDTLLRRRELLELPLGQVRRERHHGAHYYLITVSKATAKARKMREIPVFSRRLIEFLDGRHKAFARFPFGQLDGSRISVTQFETDWRNVRIAAGLDAFEWHQGRRRYLQTKDGDLEWRDLRREGASRMHDHGVPLRRIQKLLGHSSLERTQRYLALKDDDLVESVQHVARALGL